MKYEDAIKNDFVDALVDAYPSRVHINNLANAANFKWRSPAAQALSLNVVVRGLVDWAEGELCLIELLDTAVQSNNENRRLQQIVRLLRPYQKPLREVGTELSIVEKRLFKNAEYADVGPWLEGLARIRRAVCRVELQTKGQDGHGTGFLIAPDLVITNWLVAEPFWQDKTTAAATVRVRFDYEQGGQGTLYGIKPEWTLPHSMVEEFDFALLRLDLRATANSRPREPLAMAANYEFQPDEPILILQYPDAAPLTLAFGTLDARQDEDSLWPNNFWYSGVEVERGSSGAPCITQDLEIVGLHHFSEIVKNRGVRASTILPRVSEYLRLPKHPAPAEENLPPKKRAFIVQAAGKDGSDERIRADFLISTLIEPACEEAGYTPVIARRLKPRPTTEPILSDLFTDPLVIADLGTQPWDPDTMIEVGFRLSTGRPIVLISDTPPDNDDLPRHLRSVPIASVGSLAPENAKAQLVDCINGTRDDAPSQAWASQFAYVDFRLAIGNPNKSVYLYANAQAAEIYGCKHVEEIIGRRVQDIDQQVSEYMSASHRQLVAKDQKSHYGELLFAAANGDTLQLTARVPLWFIKHPFEQHNNRLYLPVISNYKIDTKDNAIVMRAVYLDITDWKEGRMEDRNPTDVWVPCLFRRPKRSFKYDVFLPFDSSDTDYAAAVERTLSARDVEIWVSRGGAENADPKDVITAMSESRIVVLSITERGMGKWQETPEIRDELVRYCSSGAPKMLLVLPNAQGDDQGSWKALIPQIYREALTDCLDVQIKSPDELAPTDNQPTCLEQVFRALIKLLRHLE